MRSGTARSRTPSRHASRLRQGAHLLHRHHAGQECHVEHDHTLAQVGFAPQLVGQRVRRWGTPDAVQLDRRGEAATGADDLEPRRPDPAGVREEDRYATTAPSNQAARARRSAAQPVTMPVAGSRPPPPRSAAPGAPRCRRGRTGRGSPVATRVHGPGRRSVRPAVRPGRARRGRSGEDNGGTRAARTPRSPWDEVDAGRTCACGQALWGTRSGSGRRQVPGFVPQPAQAPAQESATTMSTGPRTSSLTSRDSWDSPPMTVGATHQPGRSRTRPPSAMSPPSDRARAT